MRQPHWQARRRTFLWELTGGKATTAGARGAMVIQTPGDKSLEENLGTRAGRKGLILKMVWKTGGCANTGAELQPAPGCGSGSSMSSATCGRDVEGQRGEVVRKRFRAPWWPGWVSANISEEMSDVNVKLNYWKAK